MPETRFKVSMIAAMAHDRVIGTGHGGIPFRLPRDVQHFRSYTAGHHMLLGRKTFEEMQGWFRTQTPIILTTQEEYEPGLGHVVSSIPEAIEIAKRAGDSELVVSGGASIYKAALPYTDELILTLVDADIEGGAHFPDYEAHSDWLEQTRAEFPADLENEFPITFLTLVRA